FPANSYCLRCERARSSFDTLHRFIVSGLWDLPIGKGKRVDLRNRFADAIAGGWQLGSTITAQSGFPVSETIGGTDRSGTGGGFDRPNTTGVSSVLDNPTPSKWWNIAAFQLQPAGTYGNAGRNALTGPGVLAWDFSTHKEFRIHEEHK